MRRSLFDTTLAIRRVRADFLDEGSANSFGGEVCGQKEQDGEKLVYPEKDNMGRNRRRERSVGKNGRVLEERKGDDGDDHGKYDHPHLCGIDQPAKNREHDAGSEREPYRSHDEGLEERKAYGHDKSANHKNCADCIAVIVTHFVSVHIFFS